MTDYQVLTIGENPNIVFYAWRLLQTKSCSVSVVNGTLLVSDPIRFESSLLGTNDNALHAARLYNSIEQVETGLKFDLVILSSSSLQQFQSICQSLTPFLNDNTTILVESTGFVNLEPFITLSLPKFKNLTIASVMNELDIRLLRGNLFSHTTRANESRLYIGSPTSSKKNGGPTFQKTLKLFQSLQDTSQGKINLLIANLSKEFMTYQWKLALPRIIFGPLSIIFETVYPKELSQQILCKPLVTGLITEIFKIIKKMDCKLVKGSENEANLWKNWLEQFPDNKIDGNSTKNGAEISFLDSPNLFYNYYHQYDLEIDLLLLQPILLADDHGIRTPYLENLYSVMCQYIKVNDPNVDLVFFQRKNLRQKSKYDTEAIDNEYREKSNHIELMNQDYDSKSSKLSRLNQQVNDLQLHFKSLEISHTNKEVEANQINIDIERNKLELEKLISQLNEKTSQLNSLDKEIATKSEKPSSFKTPETAQVPFMQTKNVEPQGNSNNYRQSLIASPNAMREMSDVALYGAVLNGEVIQEEGELTATKDENAQPQFNGYRENGERNGIPDKLLVDTKNVQKPRAYDQNQGLQAQPVGQGPMQGQPQGHEQAQGFNGQAQGQGHEQANGFNGQVQSGQAYNRGFQQNGQFSSGNPQQQYGSQSFVPQQQQQQQFSQQNQQFSQQNQQFPQQQQQFPQQQYNNNSNQNQQYGYKQNNQGNGPQSNGFYPSPMEQHPPHGLHTNGNVAPIFNNNLPMNNRFQQQQQQQQQLNMGMHPQKQRLSSIPSSIHSYYDQQQNGPGGYGPNGPSQNGSNYYGPNGGYSNGYSGGNGPNGPNGYGGSNMAYQNAQKKNGRRSMFPQLTGNSLQGLDMGGRGGMPMPTGPTGERPASSGQVKNRPVTMSSPPMNQRKSQAELQVPAPVQHSSSGYLQIPNTNRSNTSSLSTNDTPKTSQSRDDISEGMQIQVPTEVVGKPLGIVKDSSAKEDGKKKKKKSGMFGKKK